MEHFELHVVLTHEDERLAQLCGLVEEDEPENSCDHCDEPVGYDYELGKFYPYAIALDEDDEITFACEECFTPVVFPARVVD